MVRMRRYAAASVVAFVVACTGTAGASRDLSACPSSRWCHDVRVLKNAVYVLAPYGTFHLRRGGYAGGGIRILLAVGPRLIAFDGRSAAVVTRLHAAGTRGGSEYVHVMRRLPSGLYEDTAAERLTGVRAVYVTLHGSRLRVGAIGARGRQITIVYGISPHHLQTIGTRRAQ